MSDIDDDVEDELATSLPVEALLAGMSDASLSLELVAPSNGEVSEVIQGAIARRALDEKISLDEKTAQLLRHWHNSAENFKAVVVLADKEGKYHYVASEVDDQSVAMSFVKQFSVVKVLANGNRVVRVVVYPPKSYWRNH